MVVHHGAFADGGTQDFVIPFDQNLKQLVQLLRAQYSAVVKSRSLGSHSRSLLLRAGALPALVPNSHQYHLQFVYSFPLFIATARVTVSHENSVVVLN